MAHEVESMFYKGEVPWHGLGKRIPEEKRVSVADAIEAAGCDWEVGVRPLFTEKQVQVDYNYTYRKTDEAILGYVGPQYTPLQNKEAFEFFQPFLDKAEAEFHTAGALFGGRKMWVLAKLNRESAEVTKDDRIDKFILLSNSHDGTQAVRVGFTPIRVVCANTMAMAHTSDASKLIRVRHSSSVKTNIENIRDVMNAANSEFEKTADLYKLLANADINQSDLAKYIVKVLDVKFNKEGDMSTRMGNIISGIMQKFDGHMKGDEVVGTKKSWWRGYNAINEYLNYSAGAHSTENRLDSLWFGANFNKNKSALSIALETLGA